jgi:hypothetical protein
VNRTCLAIGLLVMVMAGLLPACSESSDVIHVDANVKKASLTEIWESVEDKTGVQNSSANLAELIIWLSEEGTVELLHYMFYGKDAHGKDRMYFVNSEHDGDVTCYSADGVGVLTETDPLGVFEELDGVPRTTVLSGEASAHIGMDFTWGGVKYGGSTSFDGYHLADLYRLESGELLPLKEVVFHTTTPWGVLRVSRYADQATSPDSVEYWFLTSELGKAELVEYTFLLR